MKKRLLTAFLCLLLAVGFTLALTSCGDEETETKEPELLEAPVVTISGDTVKWAANSQAERFEISVNGTVTFVENTVTGYKLTDGQIFKVRAIGDGTNTKTSEWSNAVVYNAPSGEDKPDDTTPTYTITWKNGDVVLETDTVEKGEIPEYNGETPIKAGHTFIGWMPEVKAATADTTYVAQFKEDTAPDDGSDDNNGGNEGDNNGDNEGGNEDGNEDDNNDNNNDNNDNNDDNTNENQGVNTVFVTFAEEGNGVVVAEFTVKGDVSLAMLELQLSLELDGAEYESYELEEIGLADANYVDGVFYYSFMAEDDVTEEVKLFSIRFTCEGENTRIEMRVVDSATSDGSFENIATVTVNGASYEK